MQAELKRKFKEGLIAVSKVELPIGYTAVLVVAAVIITRRTRIVFVVA